MYPQDPRPEHLGWIETALRVANPDLPRLRITAQSHFGPHERIAFVAVHGLSKDRDRGARLRLEADKLLHRLGYTVELEYGRDVYDVAPSRPASAHDEIRMLRCLRAACEASDAPRPLEE